jgi:hypothetical protein
MRGGSGGGASEAGVGRGGSRPRSEGRWRWTGGVAGVRASASRWTADPGRPAVVENPGGQMTGGVAEGGSRGG